MLGHWSGAAIVTSYLTGMPFEAALARGGHPLDTYLCARADVQIPDELMEAAKQRIFPFAEEALEHFRSLVSAAFMSR